MSRVKLQERGFFKSFDLSFDTTVCPFKVLNSIIDYKMIDVFPNIYIAYHLFLTIPIANCEFERSFSVLKRIKDILSSTMGDERLS